MLLKNTPVLTVFVVSGAVTAAAGCVFARKGAHAESFPCRSKLSSMRRIIRLILVSNGLLMPDTPFRFIH